MPKIHIVGAPLDLYRYKTFLNVLIEEKRDWGVSLEYDANQHHIKRNFFKKAINSLSKLVHNLYCVSKADYVYYPPMVLFGTGLSSRVIMKFCEILNKRVIFDFYISMYDTIVLDRKIMNPDDSKSIILRNLDRWGHTRYRSIYLNTCEANRYRRLNNLEIDDNTRIIPLSIESRPFAKLPYFTSSYNKVFNMVWWGTYIPLHGLDKILDSCRILIKRHRNVHLYILGNNSNLSKEYKLIVENDELLKEKVTISDEYTFSNGKLLPLLTEKCDLAFGAFGDSEKARTVILNKAIEAVAMKIPVITQYSDAFEEFFYPGTTIFYTENNPESMANNIDSIMAMDRNSIIKRIDRAYQVYEDNFSISASKKNFKSLLDELK